MADVNITARDIAEALTTKREELEDLIDSPWVDKTREEEITVHVDRLTEIIDALIY